MSITFHFSHGPCCQGFLLCCNDPWGKRRNEIFYLSKAKVLLLSINSSPIYQCWDFFRNTSRSDRVGREEGLCIFSILWNVGMVKEVAWSRVLASSGCGGKFTQPKVHILTIPVHISSADSLTPTSSIFPILASSSFCHKTGRCRDEGELIVFQYFYTAVVLQGEGKFQIHVSKTRYWYSPGVPWSYSIMFQT